MINNQLKTKSELCKFLNISVRTLNLFLYGLNESQKYTHFQILKRNGSPRIISAPVKGLKDIQRVVLEKILTPAYTPSVNAFAYILDRGILENADIHVGNNWQLKIDLKDFFPSINFGRIYGLFKKPPFKFNDEVATILTQICCSNNQLPQGAPTSPILSNLICKRLDSKLNAIAIHHRCNYTRYADDIVFSTSRNQLPKYLGYYSDNNEIVLSDILKSIIDTEGFTINDEKIKLSSLNQRKLVTGIIVNKKTNIPRDYYRELRSALCCWERKGYPLASQIFFEKFDNKNRPPNKPLPEFKEILRGKINHVGYVKGYGDPIFQKLSKKLAALDSDYIHKESAVIRYGRQSVNIRLICEGKTDLELIESAHKHFYSMGRFKNINIHYDFKSSDKGDSDLKKMSEMLSRSDQTTLTVCLFDRDQPSIIKEMGGEESGFVKRGHNLYTAVLPTPSHRNKDDFICIEMLFDDETIKTPTQDGLRLFLKSEFDPNNGCHQSEAYVLLTPKKSSLIIDDDVIDVAAKRNVALSKKKFASLISHKSQPFFNINYSGFESLFNLLIQIHYHSINS